MVRRGAIVSSNSFWQDSYSLKSWYTADTAVLGLLGSNPKNSTVFQVNRVSRIPKLGALIPWSLVSHAQQNRPYSLAIPKRTSLYSMRHFDHFSKSMKKYTRNKFSMYTSFMKSLPTLLPSLTYLTTKVTLSEAQLLFSYLPLIILSCKLSLIIPPQLASFMCTQNSNHQRRCGLAEKICHWGWA